MKGSCALALAASFAFATGCTAIFGVEEKSCNACYDEHQELACEGDTVTARECESGSCKNGGCVPCEHPDIELCPEGECLDEVLSLSATYRHACAVLGDGSVWCWGDNTNGELGIAPTPTVVTRPVRVPGIRASKVVAGALNTCALVEGEGSQAGSVYCWGSNIGGQLGRSPDDLGGGGTPVRVPGLPSLKDLTVGGAHVCALSDCGRLYCWGVNYVGQCGENAGWPTTAPECEADQDTVRTLPRWSVAPREVKLPNVPRSTIKKVLAVKHTTCALVGTDLFCWGSNCGADDQLGLTCTNGGQLGEAPEGGVCYDATPRSLLPFVIDFGMSYGSVYALTQTANGNLVYAWGANEGDQLGNGLPENFTADARAGAAIAVKQGPEGAPPLKTEEPKLPPLTNVIALFPSLGADQCAAVSPPKDGNRFWCWGSDHQGELLIRNDPGNAQSPDSCGVEKTAKKNYAVPMGAALGKDSPMRARLQEHGRELVHGDEFGCAIVDDAADGGDEILCWGNSRYLGNGSSDSRKCTDPVRVEF